MGKFLIKRLGQSLGVLFIVTVLVFGVLHLMPGDPIQIYLGETATPEQIEIYTREFGLDRPVFIQYIRWIGGLFQGNMGMSIVFRVPVVDIIPQRIRTTLTLTIPAFVFATITGIFLGVAAAKNRNRFIDSAISVFANLGIATPTFWIGMIVVYIFSLRLNILPVQGFVPLTENFGESVRRLVLPVFVLSLGQIASITRQTRSAMLEVISQDYIRTARSKGLKEGNITFFHALRNAMIPIVTLLGGSVGRLVGGTVIMENLFVIPGMGSLMITAINNKDYMVVQNVVFIMALFIVICNLIVDILYGYVDPRIRVEE